MSDKNIRDVIITLQKELLKHGEVYDAFLSSIRSAIDDTIFESSEVCAEHILKRIIGEE